MSSTQEGSSSQAPTAKKADKGRRIWTQQEEAILIATVKEVIAHGWKSDNGFRAGYLNKLEESVQQHYPNTDLRADPHIHSKLSMWKTNYDILCNILSRSGVAINTNAKIDCEDNTWESIIKADPRAKQMRHKSWPYFDVWKEIFGKDQANGEGAEDVYDANNEMRSQGNETLNDDVGGDYFVSFEDIVNEEAAAESNSNNQKRGENVMKPAKKQKTADAIQGVCDILVEIGRKTDARLASLAESLGYEASLGKALEDAFLELGNIPSLTIEERFEVCTILGTQPDKLKIFKGMPIASRPKFVEWLLSKFHYHP